MVYGDTVWQQLIVLVPRYEFDSLAKSHHAGKKFRAYKRWSQFLTMLVGQISSRKSLRNIADGQYLLKRAGRKSLGITNDQAQKHGASAPPGCLD